MKDYSLHNISANIVEKINRYTQKEGVELQKMIFGMEILLHNIPKLVLMFAVAILLGILPQTFVTWLSFALVRRYASGLHASNSITCTITTILMFVLVPYMVQNIYINILHFSIIFGIIILVLHLYAPADTQANPIIGESKRKRLRKSALISSISIFLITSILIEETYRIYIAFGAIYAGILILPITYKLLKRRMKNYEQYE